MKIDIRHILLENTAQPTNVCGNKLKLTGNTFTPHVRFNIYLLMWKRPESYFQIIKISF